MPDRSLVDSARSTLAARLWPLDLVVVGVFVAIGRDTHDEGNALGGFLTTVAPFVVGVAVAWAVAGPWSRPVSWRIGVLVALVTVAVGMLVRRIGFDDGTATSFVIVATVFNLVAMVGWRLVAGLLDRRTSTA